MVVKSTSFDKMQLTNYSVKVGGKTDKIRRGHRIENCDNPEKSLANFPEYQGHAVWSSAI